MRLLGEEGKTVIEITEGLRRIYPDALAGVMLMRGVANPACSHSLDAAKDSLSSVLRDRFRDRQAIAGLPAVRVYSEYYRRFKKTYHVLMQLESVAVKGRPLPGGAALVEAMFMAELKNALLTAGHDYDRVAPPLRLDVARGGESYTRLNGETAVVKAGDILLTDAEGILGSIIYGPDRRSSLTSATKNALFVIYGLPGLLAADLWDHLADIAAYVHLVAPAAVVEEQAVIRAE